MWMPTGFLHAHPTPKNMEKHGYEAALGIALAEIENPRKKGTSEEFSVCMVEAYDNAAFI